MINPDKSYDIILDNVGYNQDVLPKINEIIRHYTSGKELFFGHYKYDGFHISNREFKQYGLEIHNYFQTSGEYYQMTVPVFKNGKIINLPCDLTVCRAPNNDKTYQILDKVFNYFLETVVFSPKITWETFIDSYMNYMNIRVSSYIKNNYTDFLFSYIDSGDFSVTFDPLKHNPETVRKYIEHCIWG